MTIDRILELGMLAVVLSTFWIGFVLLVRVPVSRWLGSRWAYYLWLVPFLGLIALAVPTPPAQQIPDIPVIEIPMGTEFIKAVSGVNEFISEGNQFGPVPLSASLQSLMPKALLSTWLLGALWFLCCYLSSTFRYSMRIKSTSQPLTKHQQELFDKRHDGLARLTSSGVRLSSTAKGPALTGLFRPVLLLPTDFFQGFSRKQQSLMLEHEYQHCRRHDLTALFIARLIRCLFWFNPLVYVAERYLQADQELSCDELVLAEKDQESRRIYGETLLLSSRDPVSILRAYFASSFGQLKQRIFMLRHHNKRLSGCLAGSFLLVASAAMSVVYSVIGAIELQPNLAFRDELRVPIEQALARLNTESIDATSIEAMLSEIGSLESGISAASLSEYESAQLKYFFATLHSRNGDMGLALSEYQEVVSLARDAPELKAMALYSSGEILFKQNDFASALSALMHWELINKDVPTPESWALRSQVLVKLKRWEHGLHYITRAIEESEAMGVTPNENWLLLETALRWKQGDLEGASRSLAWSMKISSEDNYQKSLAVFNQLVQESWEPLSNEELVAQF